MALLTAGTKTTSSLSALQYKSSGMNQTDFAALCALIKQYNVNGTPIAPGALSMGGQLFFPNGRGMCEVRNLDWMVVDGAGYPQVIPNSVFSTSWQHS